MEASAPVYTVVMAARPGEPFLVDAVESVEQQTLPPDRIVIVVNGPGAAGDVAAQRAQRSNRNVDVLTLDRPSMPAALARGLSTVTTPFVAFLDSDDLWEPDKQRRQLKRLAAAPHLDAVTGRTVNFRLDDSGSPVLADAKSGAVFSATTFRTDAFARFGLPDADADHFAWLYRWWANARAAGIVTATDDYPGLRRRVHDANGWVTRRDEGRAVLLAEIRRIQRERRVAAEPSA